MLDRLTKHSLVNQKGLTLVELMIVVAIIGILASLAGAAFYQQTINAKMTQLEQYAMDLSRGQQEFSSHHNSYFPVDNSQVPTFSGSDAPNTGVRQVVRQVMGFDQPMLPEDVTVRISAGEVGEPCSPVVCINGITVDTNTAWYVITVEQDLDPGETDNSTVIVTSQMEKPLRLNEGS